MEGARPVTTPAPASAAAAHTSSPTDAQTDPQRDPSTTAILKTAHSWPCSQLLSAYAMSHVLSFDCPILSQLKGGCVCVRVRPQTRCVKCAGGAAFPGRQRRRRPHSVFLLQAAPAVTASNPGAARMTGEGCRRPPPPPFPPPLPPPARDWKHQENFSHASLPLSPIDSATSHHCQSATADSPPRRGSGEQGAARPQGHFTGAGEGPPGPPPLLKRLPGQDATAKAETVCLRTPKAHGREAQRGETSGAALCRQKEQLSTVGGGGRGDAAPSDVTASLEKTT